MSAELALLSTIKQKRDMYGINSTSFDPIRQIDVSGLFPTADLTTRKIVLDIVGENANEFISTIRNVDPFDDNSGKILYRFENNVLDDSGNFNGTAYNLNYAIGKFGSASLFNGSNSYINANIPAVATTRTFSFWIKYTEIPTSLRITFSGGTVTCQSQNSNIELGVQDTFGGWHTILVPIVLNQYMHIVFTQTPTGIIVYVNGVLFDGLACSSQASSPFSYITLGRFGPNNEYYFNGSLDQFRIFDRALTQEEVTILYNEKVQL